MRGDRTQSSSFRQSHSWGDNEGSETDGISQVTSEQISSVRQSFSGHERNKLFFSLEAKKFVDLSTISGLDNIADSRVLSICDFDRDGWEDMVVVNANAPALNIYRNDIGSLSGSANTGHMIAIRFVGGSRIASPNSKFGNRDGYGAKVTIIAGAQKYVREHHCGEGMAGQNSTTMIVGIGESEKVESVSIRWLSGIEQKTLNVHAGTLLTVYEDPQTSPGKVSETRAAYVTPSETRWTATDWSKLAPSAVFSLGSTDDIHAENTAPSKLLLYTTMATWCAACKNHQPQLEHLRATFDSESLAFYGIPIDASDDATKLKTYVERFKPTYELLIHLSDDQKQEAMKFVSDAVHSDALPSSVVTDADGNVVLITGGIPTVSQLRKLLQRQ